MEYINNEIVVFEDGELKLNVAVSLDNQTVWLSQKQMSNLFYTSVDNIGLHIKNICEEGELELNATTEEFSVVQKEGKRNVRRVLIHYNLDMILSVGYRVKSKRATEFRRWATTVLKQLKPHNKRVLTVLTVKAYSNRI